MNNQAIQKLCDAGLHLVEIPPIDGKPVKAPTSLGWNRPRTTNNPKGYSHDAADFAHCNGFNLGVYHGASDTLALDLDNVELARKVFEDATNTQLTDWLENDLRVEIKSPKANRGKLIYRLPYGFTDAKLRQLKFEGNVIFELRCGNCQDVIYGQHPEGGEYQLIGDPAAIPEAPPILLDMLRHWEAWKPCFESALGIKQTPPKIKPHKPQQGEHIPGIQDPIQEFNQSYGGFDVLIRNKYNPSGKDRLIRPGSESKAPGVVILKCKDGIERVFSHGGDVLNDGYAHDAFDCMRLLEHGGDWAAALNWNPEITRHNQQLFRQEKAAKQKQKPNGKPQTPPQTDPAFVDDGIDYASMPDYEEIPPIGEQSPRKTEKPQFNLVSIADVLTNPPDPQGYVWAGRIPFGVVTLLAAHGGTGKSLLALLLAICVAVGREFLGLPTACLKTIFFQCRGFCGHTKKACSGDM